MKNNVLVFAARILAVIMIISSVAVLFTGCSKLTSVDLGKGVTYIHAYAFTNCSGLTAITIPGNVTTIGEGAFRFCRNLTIYTSAGSYAEKYAKENNIPFVAE